jgi:hypothetical protein
MILAYDGYSFFVLTLAKVSANPAVNSVNLRKGENILRRIGR